MLKTCRVPKFNNNYEYLLFLSRCTLRFPSTNVKISFQVLHGSADNSAVTSSAAVSSPSPAKPMQPLHISIPKPAESVSVFASPCPSPTGTIRFASFCQLLGVFLYSVWFALFPGKHFYILF